VLKIKKDPLLITLILTDILNKLKIDKKYNINNIKQFTQLHWNTIHKYIKLIKFIQEYVPPLNINIKNNKIEYFKITGFSNFINHNYQNFEKLIIYLMINNVFNENSSINYKNIKKFKFSKKDIKFLSENGLIKIINNENIYLTDLGIKIGTKMMLDLNKNFGKIFNDNDIILNNFFESKPKRDNINLDNYLFIIPIIYESKEKTMNHPLIQMIRK